MSALISVVLGFSLSAAAGFRVFVPFLVISVATKAGMVQLSDGFSWIGSTPALILFCVATIIELLAYYVPYIDNLLDVLAVPLAIIAGSILMATFITDMSPMLKWTLAIVAGGGISVGIHSVTAVFRGASTTMTAGIGNSIVSTFENIISTLISILAIFSPIIAIIIIIVSLFYVIKFIKKKRYAKSKRSN